MHHFSHDGLSLSYVDDGPQDGPSILLVHGFASNKYVNWINPGWVQTLNEAGYRTIAFDNRGHGESDKPHDTAAYTPEKMADDAAALLTHLGLETAHVMGYSMGARISAFLALRNPARVRSLIFGGLGLGMVEGVGDWDPIADALLADSLADVTHEQGRAFRYFADQTKSDRLALAACIQSSRTLLTPEQLASLETPALVAVGTKDDIAGSATGLAAMLPNGSAFDIERRDHMLAVGDASFKRRALEFLTDQNA